MLNIEAYSMLAKKQKIQLEILLSICFPKKNIQTDSVYSPEEKKFSKKG